MIGPLRSQPARRVTRSAPETSAATVQMPASARSIRWALAASRAAESGGAAKDIRATRRAPSIQPVSARVGTSTARASRTGLHAPYQRLIRSQWCRPTMACSHTTRSKRDCIIPGWPQQSEFKRIGGLDTVEGAEPACRHDVRDREERDPEPKCNLSGLPGRHPPCVTADELPECQADMHGSGSIEEKRARP